MLWSNASSSRPSDHASATHWTPLTLTTLTTATWCVVLGVAVCVCDSNQALLVSLFVSLRYPSNSCQPCSRPDTNTQSHVHISTQEASVIIPVNRLKKHKQHAQTLKNLHAHHRTHRRRPLCLPTVWRSTCSCGICGSGSSALHKFE